MKVSHISSFLRHNRILTILLAANLFILIFQEWNRETTISEQPFKRQHVGSGKNQPGPLQNLKNLPLNNKRSFVLRLMKNDCHECLDSILNATKGISKRFKTYRVHIWMNNDYSLDDYAKYKRLLQYENLDIDYVNFKVSNLDDQLNSYFFAVDKSDRGTIINPYIIRKKEDVSYKNVKFNKWLKLFD